MLGDVERYRDWLNREQPTDSAQHVAAKFIAAAADAPCAYPSYPADTSGQPVFEERAVTLPVPGEPDVRIPYRRIYATEEIHILDITNC